MVGREVTPQTRQEVYLSALHNVVVSSHEPLEGRNRGDLPLGQARAAAGTVGASAACEWESDPPEAMCRAGAAVPPGEWEKRVGCAPWQSFP